MSEHSLILNKENTAVEVKPFSSENELITAFVMALKLREIEATEEIIEQGFYNFDDGTTLCMHSTNYWIGSIVEVFSGFETSANILLIAPSYREAEELLLAKLSKQRGDDFSDMDLALDEQYDGHESSLMAKDLSEIPKEDYVILSKYL